MRRSNCFLLVCMNITNFLILFILFFFFFFFTLKGYWLRDNKNKYKKKNPACRQPDLVYRKNITKTNLH